MKGMVRIVYFTLIVVNLYAGIRGGHWYNFAVSVAVAVMWFLLERGWREDEENRKY